MSYAQLNGWSLSIGRLVADIDSPGLLRTLVDELAAAVTFDTWFTAVFYMEGPPFILDYLGMEHRQETYAEGPYLLDPYYNAYLAGAGHGCFSLRQLAPDDFTKTEYYRTYYRHIGVNDGSATSCRSTVDPRAMSRSAGRRRCRAFPSASCAGSGRRAGGGFGDAPPVGRSAGADAHADAYSGRLPRSPESHAARLRQRDPHRARRRNRWASAQRPFGEVDGQGAPHLPRHGAHLGHIQGGNRRAE